MWKRLGVEIRTRVGKNLGSSNITCVAELKDQKESYRGGYSQEELTECSN